MLGFWAIGQQALGAVDDVPSAPAVTSPVYTANLVLSGTGFAVTLGDTLSGEGFTLNANTASSGTGTALTLDTELTTQTD